MRICCSGSDVTGAISVHHAGAEGENTATGEGAPAVGKEFASAEAAEQPVEVEGAY